MKKHPDFFVVPLPEVCRKCGNEFLDHAEEHTDMNQIMRYCEHTGTLVHASLGKHEGKRGVMRWTLLGPMTEAEAAAQIVEVGKSQGAEPHLLHDQNHLH